MNGLRGQQPRGPRTRRRLSLYFKPKDSEEAPRPGFTEDLSQKGMFVQTTMAYGRGTMLELTFETPEGKLTITGKVVWAKRSQANLARNKRSGMGIRVREMPAILLAMCRAA